MQRKPSLRNILKRQRLFSPADMYTMGEDLEEDKKVIKAIMKIWNETHAAKETCFKNFLENGDNPMTREKVITWQKAERDLIRVLRTYSKSLSRTKKTCWCCA